MSEEKIRVILKRPGEKAFITEIPNTLEALQNEVGGWIEITRPFSDAAIICNEEGKIKELPFNMRIPGDVLVGDIIVIGTKGEELDDIPIEFARWKEFCRRLV